VTGSPGIRPRPIVLIVIDGFGIGRDPAGDAIAASPMPVWRQLQANWPHSVLGASEGAVGLPDGQMGNSEVGHLNLGAGRPVLQELPRIDAAIADGSFARRPALLAAAARAATTGRPLHVISLIGPGGVHANDRHLVALVELAHRQGVGAVRIHALLDGRDTPPSSALGFVRDLEARLAGAHPDAAIASVGGRYYAMDRDRRWDRIERGYDAIVHGEGERRASSATRAIAEAYDRGETDEFVTPTVIDLPGGTVREGDAIVHANFRADRARQLTHALADGPAFDGFDRTSPSGRPAPTGLLVVTMTEYEERLAVEVAFPPETAHSLAEAFSVAGWRQAHIAETEKYAHVTYFFNGGVEDPFPGEERILVPSNREVATYDLAPDMSAGPITDALVAAIDGGQFDFIVANYANPDMVGHTGVWEAAIRAAEVVDGCLGRLARAALGTGSPLVITADHGNIEEMRDAAGMPQTKHTTSPVPVVLVSDAHRSRRLRDGALSDVAPTLCELLGIPPGPEMTGTSLIRGS
jgi:2,3-bisphosphoglycerate-independent phosphoglycerate mutase